MEFAIALERFKEAARQLEEAWEPGQEVTGYPEWMPSFDEAVLEFMNMEKKLNDV